MHIIVTQVTLKNEASLAELGRVDWLAAGLGIHEHRVWGYVCPRNLSLKPITQTCHAKRPDSGTSAAEVLGPCLPKEVELESA